MADDEWYRNKSWDPDIAASFGAKLKRARRKSQYLRIQASYLASSHPETALSLLEQYFQQDEDFDHAAAHVTRAEAYLALNRSEDAFRAYEAALRREAEFRNLRTGAYLDFPYQIALQGSSDRYAQALSLLSEAEPRLMFAADHFVFHATKALILADQGNNSDARVEARLALDVASQTNSGIRYHPTVGLVSGRHSKALQALQRWCDA